MQNHIQTEQYSLALDGHLTPAEEQRMRLHLLDCAACRAEWQLWQDVSKQLTEAPMVAVPAGFVERVEQRLARQSDRQRPVVGGALLLTGSVALWTLVAVGLLLAGLAVASLQPGLIGAVVLFAVRLAAFTQPLIRGLQLLVEGMGRVPLQLITATTGALLLLLAIGWAQLVEWHRRTVVNR